MEIDDESYGSQLKYTYYLTFREHKDNNKAVYTYVDHCEQCEADISLEDAQKFITWVHSWNIFNVSSYTAIPRKEVIHQMRNSFPRNTNSDENVQLLNNMYEILDQSLELITEESFNNSQSLLEERPTLIASKDTPVRFLLDTIVHHLFQCITFHERALEQIPLVNSDFVVYYILLIILTNMTKFEPMATYNNDTIIMHLFSSMLVDIITDRLTRILWMDRKPKLVQSILKEFKEHAPNFKYPTDVKDIQPKTRDTILEFKYTAPYNLHYTLLYYRFDQKNRIICNLRNFFEQIKMKPDFAEAVYNQLDAYIKQIKHRNIIYDVTLFTDYLFAIKGLIEAFNAFIEDSKNKNNAISKI